MTLAEAQAQHDAYFHLWGLAQACATANEHDWPRRNAFYAVRDFCASRLRQTFADFAADFGADPEDTA